VAASSSAISLLDWFGRDATLLARTDGAISIRFLGRGFSSVRLVRFVRLPITTPSFGIAGEASKRYGIDFLAVLSLFSLPVDKTHMPNIVCDMTELFATSSALKRLLRFRRTVRLKRLPHRIFGSGRS